MKKAFRYVVWLLPISYMVLIFIMSSLPHNAVVELPDSQIDRILKESMHLIEFAILYLLLVLAFVINGKLSIRTNLVIAIFSALYGVSDEIHQFFVPYRSATLIDVIKDWIGVLAAWGHIRYHYFKRKQSVFNKLETYFMKGAER